MEFQWYWVVNSVEVPGPVTHKPFRYVRKQVLRTPTATRLSTVRGRNEGTERRNMAFSHLEHHGHLWGHLDNFAGIQAELFPRADGFRAQAGS